MVSPRARGLPRPPASFLAAALALLTACGGGETLANKEPPSPLCDAHVFVATSVTPQRPCLPYDCTIEKGVYRCRGRATLDEEANQVCTYFSSPSCDQICAPTTCHFEGSTTVCDEGCSATARACLDLDQATADYDVACPP